MFLILNGVAIGVKTQPKIIYLLFIPPSQLSLWEETGVPGENPRLSAERWLHSFHGRTGFKSTLGGSNSEP